MKEKDDDYQEPEASSHFDPNFVPAIASGSARFLRVPTNGLKNSSSNNLLNENRSSHHSREVSEGNQSRLSIHGSQTHSAAGDQLIEDDDDNHQTVSPHRQSAFQGITLQSVSMNYINSNKCIMEHDEESSGS